jgi:hypothetical protein
MDNNWILIGPLVVLYAVLLVAGLATWFRSPQTRCLSRWLWLPIIVVFSMLGPLAFLLLGRPRAALENGSGR